MGPYRVTAGAIVTGGGLWKMFIHVRVMSEDVSKILKSLEQNKEKFGVLADVVKSIFEWGRWLGQKSYQIGVWCTENWDSTALAILAAWFLVGLMFAPSNPAHQTARFREEEEERDREQAQQSERQHQEMLDLQRQQHQQTLQALQGAPAAAGALPPIAPSSNFGLGDQLASALGDHQDVLTDGDGGGLMSFLRKATRKAEPVASRIRRLVK
jgi:hypothetical protein